MQRCDSGGIEDGFHRLTGGIDACRGLPRPFYYADGAGHGASAIHGVGQRGGWIKARNFGNRGRRGERQQVGIGRAGFGESDGLLDGRADGIGIESIGGGASCLLVDQHTHGDPLALLGHVLMDGVVREPRQRSPMRAEDGFHVRRAQGLRGSLNAAKNLAASIHREHGRPLCFTRHKRPRS